MGKMAGPVSRAIVVAAVCAGLIVSPVTALASWNQLQGDSAHSGRRDATALHQSMRLWAVNVGGEITGAPVIAPNGTVWVGAGPAGLVAVSPQGVLRHRTQVPGSVNRSPAVGSDGSAYAGTTERALHKISDTGSVLWTSTGVGGANGGVSIAPDGTILYGGTGATLRAYTPAGTERWNAQAPGEISTTPAVFGSTIYVGTLGGWLHAVEAGGATRWQFFVGSPVMSSPSVGPGGVVTVGDDAGRIHALNAEGRVLWTYQTGSQIRSTGAVGADGTVYYGAANGILYAVRGGALLWQYNTGAPILGGPAIARDTLYVGNEAGQVHGLDLQGRVRWIAETGAAIVASPAIAADGTVYIGTRSGELWAFTTGVLGPQEATKRLSGSDRVATAVRVSQAGFPYGADTAVIATGWTPWDALSGATLASAAKGPLLLSRGNALSPETAVELKRLGVRRVYILGGEGVLSRAVFDSARRIAGEAVRIAGADRYETSAEVAHEAVKLWGGAVQRSALMVSGESFYDALAAAPVACAQRWPLLLTRKSTVPKAIGDALRPLSVTQVFLIGGPGVVNYDSIRSQLYGAVTFSIAGADRFETSVEVARLAVGRGLRPTSVVLATGADFPDALTGGVLAWRVTGVLLLTRKDALPRAASDWIAERSPNIGRVFVLGSTNVVSDVPYTAAQRAAGLLR